MIFTWCSFRYDSRSPPRQVSSTVAKVWVSISKMSSRPTMRGCASSLAKVEPVSIWV